MVGSTKPKQKKKRSRPKPVQVIHVTKIDHPVLNPAFTTRGILEHLGLEHVELEPPPSMRLPDPPRDVVRTPENVIGRNGYGDEK